MVDKIKLNRLVTPGLVKILTSVGLTNLSSEQVREYKTLYETYYGNLSQRILPTLQRVGLTNLTDDEVRRYCSKR